MKLFAKIVISMLVAMPLYWAMVTAFHLLNLPSNFSVLCGLCLLIAVAAAAFFVFRAIWRR